MFGCFDCYSKLMTNLKRSVGNGEEVGAAADEGFRDDTTIQTYLGLTRLLERRTKPRSEIVLRGGILDSLGRLKLKGEAQRGIPANAAL